MVRGTKLKIGSRVRITKQCNTDKFDVGDIVYVVYILDTEGTCPYYLSKLKTRVNNTYFGPWYYNYEALPTKNIIKGEIQ